MPAVGMCSGDIIGIKEITHPKRLFQLVESLIAEFMGTALLIFLGCGSAAGTARVQLGSEVQQLSDLKDDNKVITMMVNNIYIALAFGFAVASIVHAIGHVSGGHINPAVTIAFMVTGQMSIIRGLLYMVVQYLGGFLGAAILRFLLGPKSGLGANDLPEAIASIPIGFVVEFLITMLLIVVVFSSTDGGRQDIKGSVPLAIGLTVAVCHFLALGYTGTSVNPARTVGPAIFASKLQPKNIVVYIVAPHVGGAFGGILYWFTLKVGGPWSTSKVQGEVAPESVPPTTVPSALASMAGQSASGNADRQSTSGSITKESA